MAITLNPPPDKLGIAAPFVGRWFSGSAITLQAPDTTAATATLGLPITFPATPTSWHPPATGLFGLFVADSVNPHARLAPLRDAQGKHPFTTGQIIAYFSLLPEVEARLHVLMRHVPPLTAAQQPVVNDPSGVPTRARVRSFALALPATSVVEIFNLVPATAAGVTTEADKATYLGLQFDTPPNAPVLTNGARPMAQLRRPGRFTLPDGSGGTIVQEDAILADLKNLTATFWAFDSRGRAIDPGAVAAWFSYLATQVVDQQQLVAPGGTGTWPQSGGSARVCLFADAHCVHLVNPHEGKLDVPDSPFVQSTNARLQLGGTGVTKTVHVSTSQMDFSFSAAPPPGAVVHNPAVDNAPVPRLALLPSGDYKSDLKLWLSGQDVSTGLSRDFARVAVIDIERHLIGIARGDAPSPPPTAPDDRRKADQNRPSTRVSVERITVPDTEPVLLGTIDDTTDRIVKTFSEGTTAARLVVGVGDAQAGKLDQTLPTVADSAALPSTMVETSETSGEPSGAGTFSVRTLVGCGFVDSGGVFHDQQVLLTVKVDAATTPPSLLSGAWVRAWPLGFDFRRAEHFRMEGGAGRIGNDGVARLVMALPDSIGDASALPSFDLMIARFDSTGRVKTRTYGDCRYHRPTPDNTVPQLPDPTTLPAASTWFICEADQQGPGPMPADKVSPGATVVVKSGTTFTLARRSKLPMVPATLGRALASGDIVALTQPAFKPSPDRVDERGVLRGQETTAVDPKGGLGATTGTIVDRAGRLLDHHSVASHPFGGQERLEVVASRLESADAHAVIGAAPLLPRTHELLPHFAGHPGAPAGTETHATGVRLQGRAAGWAAEYVLDRTAGLEASAQFGLGALWVRSEPALALAVKNATPPAFPTALTSVGRWAAVLRTCAFGVEGLPGAASAAIASGSYPVSVNADPDRLFNWLNTVRSGLGDQVKNAIGTQTPTVIRAIARALDRRIKVASEGARETAFALRAAFSRAEDLIYIETPAMDTNPHGPPGPPPPNKPPADVLNLFGELTTRLGAAKGLHVVLCLPSQLPSGLPRALEEIRDAEFVDAINALRNAAPERFASFCPGAGAGRSVRLASTTVIVDDVFALTGSTHLWRRGLTFDSSFAASVFDEKVTDGRPSEIIRFRRALLAGRLGLAPKLVPDDPGELVRAVQDFDLTGSFRLAARPLLVPPTTTPGQPTTPASYPTAADRKIWNPDGSQTDINFEDLVALFLAATNGASPRPELNNP